MGDPTAVVGKRLGASFIDLLIAMLISVVGLFILFDYESFGGSNVCDEADGAPNDTPVWAEVTSDGASFCLYTGSDNLTFTAETGPYLLFQVISWGYIIGNFWILQGVTGATIGKSLAGVRTVGADGQKAGVLRCIGRSILMFVDGIPWCLPYALGVGMILGTSQHRRVGDYACGTFVVDRSAMGRPLGTGGTSSGFGSSGGTQQGGWQAPGQQQGGWQQPQQQPQQGWQQPAAQPAAGGGGAPPSVPGGQGAPQWDAARNAYLQHDGAHWHQFDAATQRWNPIS